MNRKETIDAIIDTARKPMPEIADSIMYKHRETGKTYSPFGMPFNFKLAEFDKVHRGYVWRGRDGCTYGTVAASKEELIERFTKSQAKTDADFRQALEEMSDKKLASQAEYWLKEKP